MPTKTKRRLIEECKAYKLADKLSEILIYFMVIFSPWAFGSTENWSIWTMNISAYILGVLLISKWGIRRYSDFTFSSFKHQKKDHSSRQYRLNKIYKITNILTNICLLALLGYILTSAINARASFSLETTEYSYYESFNKNLPHTYDARGTWFIFWQYLGLIILFWSARDWLAENISSTSSSFNPRLKRLLFLICLNGAALSMEGIIQQIYYGDFRGKLLFLIQPELNSWNLTQFGPFAYRSNAASYLNLIWPLAIGLLIQLGRENLECKNRRIGSSPELFLIPCIILTASGPIISTSRGGTFVMIALVILSLVAVALIKTRSNLLKFSIIAVIIISIGTGYYYGWERIEPRLTDSMSGIEGRIKLFNFTIKMIEEYPVFGSGPGSFEAIAQFELNDKITLWESWAHNDFLEFRLTFGIGSIIFICLVIILSLQSVLRLFFLRTCSYFITFCLIAIFGVLSHSMIDFPLQTYVILHLLSIIIAAIQTCATNKIEATNNKDF